MRPRAKATRTFFALAAIAIGIGSMQTLPASAQDLRQADKPVASPALQALRKNVLNAPYNLLTFKSMDAMYPIRTVPHDGVPSSLPRRDRPLDFTYQFKGNTYTPAQFLDRTYTNALLVMKDGSIVSETYRNLSNPATRFIGWSMTKSMTSLLVGVAVAEKRIKSIDDDITVYLPELKSTGYDGVTIRQILEMRTGTDYTESYDLTNPAFGAGTPRASMFDNVRRTFDRSFDTKRVSPPGTVFVYATLHTQVLGALLERVSNGSTIAAYTAQRLWEPLGAESDGYYIMDGAPGVGQEQSGAGFNATLRDYARLGLMMLNDGRVDGRQVVPAEWVRESTRSSHPDAPAWQPKVKTDLIEGEWNQLGYAYQWWTVPGTKAYLAIGLQGQFIFVDPSTRTVVVKLSYFPPGDHLPWHEALQFFKAASAWKPS